MTGFRSGHPASILQVFAYSFINEFRLVITDVELFVIAGGRVESGQLRCQSDCRANRAVY